MSRQQLELLEDLGMRFPKPTSKQKSRFGRYKCECGREFETTIYSVKRGHTTSCGCYNRKQSSKALTTHGLTKHRLYKTWSEMIGRTRNSHNTAYKNYGNRGIAVSQEWQDVSVFIADMEPTYTDGMSIDRIDNNLGYSKENCRWTDRETQSRNTRLLRTTNSSGYRGVSFDKISSQWKSSIRVNSKQKTLGRFATALEAAIAYDTFVVDNSLEHTRNGVI